VSGSNAIPAIPSGAGAKVTPHLASCDTDGIMISSSARRDFWMLLWFTILSSSAFRVGDAVSLSSTLPALASGDNTGTLRTM
jgi:hypothetical protein